MARGVMSRLRALLWLLLILSALPALAAPVLEFASLRQGDIQYWRVVGDTQPVAVGLPDGLGTPLGSVWKLFVHAYLIDQASHPADYVCGGRVPEEIYCCSPGGSIGRDQALLRSCGLYFEPARLGLNAAEWSRYWQERGAPIWLQRLSSMQADTQVSVASLLQALNSVPAMVRRKTGSTLLARVLTDRDAILVQQFGGLLRAKTYSWHLPGQSTVRVGGAAGWLADGSPVWIRGPGTSATVLRQAANRLPTTLLEGLDGGGSCVQVAMFSRHGLREVRGEDGRLAHPGRLSGRFVAHFRNGNSLPFVSAGELSLLPGDTPQLVARLTENEYVARVLEREAAAEPLAAARALAVVARSYLRQEAHRSGECLSIADTSASQRVLPSPASLAARRVAAWTDSLILSGAQVHYHLDQPGVDRLAWSQAVQWAVAGASFDTILQRVWPKASLASTDSPLATDCAALPEAEHWLSLQTPRWRQQLRGEDGFEAPNLPAVCQLDTGNPYADTGRGRIYARGLRGLEDRLTLAHEYLHLAFAQHPHGKDENYIEGWTRRLLLGGAQ